jgi:hypothetical protein
VSAEQALAIALEFSRRGHGPLDRPLLAAAPKGEVRPEILDTLDVQLRYHFAYPDPALVSRTSDCV